MSDCTDRVYGYLADTGRDWNYITPVDFYRRYFSKPKMRGKYVVVDLRKAAAFRQYHLPHAKNIFWLDLLQPRNLTRLRRWAREGKKIFLICYVGHTSSQAMTLLRLLHIPVTSIKFGYGISPVSGVPVAGWLQYHYPIVSSVSFASSHTPK